jgi:hypothetical protein
MEEQAKKKTRAAQLKKNLNEIAKHGRLSTSDRVHHIRKLQKVDGVEIYAIQYTTIQRAAATDNVAGVRYFIARGDLNKPDDNGNTALHEACRFGYLNVVRALASASVFANPKNKMGQTPAHLAVSGGQPHLLELLADLGADLCAPDAGGATPAHYAAQVNRVDILEALYQLQERPLTPAPLSIPSRNGSTPAHVAAASGNVEALDFLYRAKVDLNCQDAFGETPSHKAARAQHHGAIKCLAKIHAAGGSVDFTTGNFEEDTTNDLLVDKSRYWNQEGGESLSSLRELARLRKNGEITHSDFQRLKSGSVHRRSS